MSARNPEDWMREAVELSRLGFPSPNPRVGCVIVLGDTCIGRGHHDFAGGPHAEVVALQEAGDRAKGADLYVTLEPCRHFGRTPPCSDAIVAAGIRRVFYACSDPNPAASGGAEVLRQAGVEVVSGLMEDEAREANRLFFLAFERRRPWVVLKAAVTIDGLMAREDGSSKWITGEEARAEGHRWRAELGAVLVGARTAALDQPQLTARIPGVVNLPMRLVLDWNRSLDDGLELFLGPNPTLRVVRSDLARGEDLGVLSLTELLDELGSRGILGILVEGGSHTYGRFLDDDLVDQLDLYIAPTLWGRGLAWALPGLLAEEKAWELKEAKAFGQDFRLSWWRLRGEESR